MGNRRVSRELALQVLFPIDLVNANLEESLKFIWEMYHPNQEIWDFTLSLVEGVMLNLTEINTIIKEHTDNWSLERINHIDRNILRIAIFEILYREDIPRSVSINEAIELAKKYGTENSFIFVNGILGKVNKSIFKRER